MSNYMFDFKERSFTSGDISKFRFFQYNTHSSKYFLEIGKNTVPFFPHFKVAKSFFFEVENISTAKKEYLDYLTLSWTGLNKKFTKLDLEKQYSKYSSYLLKTKVDNVIEEPIVLTSLKADDDYYIVDGNHRCSISLALDIPVKAKIISLEDTFKYFMKANEVYGSGDKGVPYQTIYIDYKPVVNGRRTDLIERLEAIPKELTIHKKIIDLGSNYGMASILAYQIGATEVLGIEKSKPLVNIATRLAVFNNTYPSVTFMCHNLEENELEINQQYDIGYLFSITKHINNKRKFIEIG